MQVQVQVAIEASGAMRAQNLDPALVFTVMSEITSWISPPTRTELIENLVSGVGVC